MSAMPGVRWVGGWCVRMAIAVVLSLGILRVLTWPIQLPALAAGWGVALANGVAAALINRAALRRREQGSPLWGMGAGGLRTAVMFAIVIAFWALQGPEDFGVFLAALMPGYFVCMFSEVAGLTRAAS